MTATKPTQQSHTLASRSNQPASQSQPKSVPAQPGKRNFQKCTTRDRKEQNNDMDRQIQTLNRLTLWAEKKKE